MAGAFLYGADWQSLFVPKKPVIFHKLGKKPDDSLKELREEFKDLSADLEKMNSSDKLPDIKERLTRRRRFLEQRERLSHLSRPKQRASPAPPAAKWSWADPLDLESGPGAYEVATPLGKPHPLSTVHSPVAARFAMSTRSRRWRESPAPSPGFYNPNADAVLRQSEAVVFSRTPNNRSLTPSFARPPSTTVPQTDRSSDRPRQFSFPKARREINVRMCKSYVVARTGANLSKKN